MQGILNVIGVGPGDPELLTLKAVRIIKESPVLCVPKGREEGSSLALSIVEKAVDLKGKEIIESHFPMVKTRTQREEKNGLDDKWNEIAETILGKLRKGAYVAFLTLGDPALYSTFFYLYDKLLELQPDLDIRIIPGVSSVNASAARAGISLGLGNDRIAVLPANYMNDLKPALESFDTVVLMKVSKVFNEIVEMLSDMNLIENAVCISNAGMDDEKIFRNIREAGEEDLNYFSTLIVKK
ncbi:MAG: precorrin-2 C(20)-methyltransferase [Nitrospirota bacterium]